MGTSLLQTAGNASIAIENPTLTTSLISNASTFLINPTPAVTAISPNSVVAGTSSYTPTLTVRNYISGVTRFVAGSSGSPLPVIGTPATGATSIQVTVNPALITIAGTVLQVRAVNFDGANPNGTIPPNYDTCSPPQTITVTAPVGPNLTAINPNPGTACGPGFPIALTGTNFQSGSQVQFTPPAGTASTLAPSSTPTSTLIMANVPAPLIQTAGAASVVTPDLRENGPVDLTIDEIRERMSGNLCRCGAYPGIVHAVQNAYRKT